MSNAIQSRAIVCILVVVAGCLILFPPRFHCESALGDEMAELEQLLNPRTLSPGLRPTTADQLRVAFSNPPAEFRAMPLWVWNDELEWPRLKEQLAQFKQQGMGGVFIHPRPGLMTEYLGSRWFELWKQSLEEGQRLGLVVNIYDENSYPAGFAGGHVPALAPDTVAQFVVAEPGIHADEISFQEAELVAAFAIESGPEGSIRKAQRVRSRAECPAGQSLLRFRLRRASGNPWTAGFPYVDLTNPQTAPLFIETTLEAYKSHFGGQFGKSIKWVFDDEPLIATAGAYDNTPLALPLSRNTLAEFQRRCRYDLADHLPSLFWDTGEWRKIRFDYWQTMHDLWKEYYFHRLFQWCDRNQVQFTGHWMEHEWPYPWISPADASFYAYEHVPGIDMLEGAGIRTKGSDPHMLFTIKQVASVAHQLDRRAFCEAYGVSGWDSTFEHYKRFGDWLMVHGINFIDQHLAFSTVRGARKRDHPQSFSDVSPWWPYYKLHGDYLGRVCYLLSQGTARNRLLVLEPTTSGFLWARRGSQTPELEELRRSTDRLVQFLADRQLDFDLADEYILQWFGKIDGRKIKVGKADYDLLVWPAHTVNLRHETLPLLKAYLEAGGEVLALADPAESVDGRPSSEVGELVKKYAPHWHSVSDLPQLETEVRRRLVPRISLDKPIPNLGFLERFLDNGDRILFLANTGLHPVTATVTVPGGMLEEWDPVSGAITKASCHAATNGQLKLALNLPSAGSGLFLARKETSPPVAAPPAASVSPMKQVNWQVLPDSLNVLVLDYCDLRVAGMDYSDVNTWRANWLVWQKHGFDRPAWDNAVQFKTRVFDRGPFPDTSGFMAAFHFQVTDPEILISLELALESPELYQVTVNGQTVSFREAVRWVDPRIKRISIAKLVHSGQNEVRISGQPFDVRMELENIYLLGKFGVVSGDKGFSLVAPEPLKFGSWAQQHYPFFSDSVLYQTEISIPEDKSHLRIDLPEWAGGVAAIILDGRQVAVLGWPPYSTEFPISAGRHEVSIRVISTPRNLFGPFHNTAKIRMKAWPAAWAEFPEHQPPGAAYDFVDYGLMKPPLLSRGFVK